MSSGRESDGHRQRAGNTTIVLASSHVFRASNSCEGGDSTDEGIESSRQFSSTKSHEEHAQVAEKPGPGSRTHRQHLRAEMGVGTETAHELCVTVESASNAGNKERTSYMMGNRSSSLRAARRRSGTGCSAIERAI